MYFKGLSRLVFESWFSELRGISFFVWLFFLRLLPWKFAYPLTIF